MGQASWVCVDGEEMQGGEGGGGRGECTPSWAGERGVCGVSGRAIVFGEGGRPPGETWHDGSCGFEQSHAHHHLPLVNKAHICTHLPVHWVFVVVQGLGLYSRRGRRRSCSLLLLLLQAVLNSREPRPHRYRNSSNSCNSSGVF